MDQLTEEGVREFQHEANWPAPKSMWLTVTVPGLNQFGRRKAVPNS